MEKQISIFLQSIPAAGHKSNMLKMTMHMNDVCDVGSGTSLEL